MSAAETYQFIRLDGYRRGPASKRGTLGSIVAEGLRRTSHISHLPGAPRFEAIHLDGPVAAPDALPAWIERQMQLAKNPMDWKGKTILRGVRKDAVAIGTIIASLPETLAEFDADRFSAFAADTTDWAREFLAARNMVLHHRLEHLDEVHPHIHLWFTPFGIEDGDGSWSYQSVLGKQKGFLHNFQVAYFNEVGRKYADKHARVMEEREARLPRHFAILKRSSHDRDVERQIRDGFTPAGEPPSRGLSAIEVNDLLSSYDDDVIDTIPAINRRLLSLRESTDHLREQLQSLTEERDALLKRLTDAESRPTQAYDNTTDQSYTVFQAGASQFLSQGLWLHLMPAVLASAQRNMNRSFHITKDEWQRLVIEDALASLMDIEKSGEVTSIEYWLAQAALAYRHLEAYGDSSSGLPQLFADSPAGGAATIDPAGPSPNVAAQPAGSRFKRAATDERDRGTPWSGF